MMKDRISRRESVYILESFSISQFKTTKKKSMLDTIGPCLTNLKSSKDAAQLNRIDSIIAIICLLVQIKVYLRVRSVIIRFHLLSTSRDKTLASKPESANCEKVLTAHLTIWLIRRG